MFIARVGLIFNPDFYAFSDVRIRPICKKAMFEDTVRE